MSLAYGGMSDEEKLANAYRPESTSAEIFSASWDRGIEDATMISAYRNTSLDEANTVGEKLDPTKLNEMFPAMNGKFTEPMTGLRAQMINDRFEENQRREQVLSRASGFWKTTALPFIGNMVGSMSDPVDFLAGTVLGAGMGAAFKGAKVASTAGAAFFENLAGNGIQNTFNEALIYKANKKELQEYSTANAFKNIVVSSAFGAGLSAGTHALFSKLAKLSDSQRVAVAQTAQEASDNGIAITHVLNQADEVIGRELEIDPQVRNAVDNTFDQETALRYNQAEDMPTLLKTMEEDVVAGKLEATTLSKFKHDLDSQGYDFRKGYMADPEARVNLADADANKIANTLDNPQNEIGYNPESEEIFNRPVEPVKTTLDNDVAQIDEKLNLATKSLDAQVEAGVLSPELRKAYDELGDAEKKIYNRNEFVKAMESCLMGAAS